MPPEAVKWVKHMIDYNASGGKMNRGLATVAVHKTLTEAKGIKLTDKVIYIYVYIFFYLFIRY